ncbi:MAG: hypothetical protein M3063_12075 [Actinomycetota bacterium]|nr:hypothetical protein [Actinomycetota bacterium]
MASPFAPPPTTDGDRTVVTVDVNDVNASLRFDVAAQEATGVATVNFAVDGPDGHPALDLRQEIDTLTLDGHPLPAEAMAPVDLGGGPDAHLRVLDVALEEGSRHRLTFAYRLALPDADGALPVGWGDDGVRFDLWMSDLMPGRYLEMWIPAPLCHDRFALNVEVEVAGTNRPHLLLTNTTGVVEPALSWVVAYPETFTSLSPMLVLAPVDEVQWRTRQVDLPGLAHPLELRSARHVEVDADLAAVEADVVGWLSYLHTRYGPWVHGTTMTVLVWGPERGMEYDAATTAAVGALEHEVFHSWFGRGVKPARASDGWIDEAWTTWSTASRRSDEPRFGASDLGLDDDAVLLCPPHPWSRHTPAASYAAGSRLFSGMAALLGGPDRLRSAMAGFYVAHRGGLVTTDDLQRHLQRHTEVDIDPWWTRYVHGQS